VSSNLDKMIAEATLPYFVKAHPDGRLAFYIDNHLITTFAFCERKFFLQHIQRLRLKGPGGMAMSIGGWWSAVLEDFYNQIKTAQAGGGNKGPRINETTFSLIPRYPTQNEFIEAAAKRWREAKMDELAAARPKAYKEFGGATGAARMALEYYMGQGKLDCVNWKIVGAEKGFGQRGEVMLYEDSFMVIYYMGKPDLVVLADNGNTLLPVEHKTIHRIPKNIQVKYKPHAQVKGYVFSLNVIAKELGYDKPVDRCIVNVAARALPAEKPRDGIRKPRFTRVFPQYSLEELEEWRLNVVGTVKRLHYSLINDEWLWKEGPNTCHLYGGCEYRGIDARPPAMRELVTKSDYVQIEAWTPYIIEDEDEEETND
jgi:PD-(D/E)XK nuclease superfamily